MEHDSLGAHVKTKTSAESSHPTKKQVANNGVDNQVGNGFDDQRHRMANSTDHALIDINELMTVAVNTIANSLIQSPDLLTEQNVSSFVTSVNELAMKLKDVSQASIGNIHSIEPNENHSGYTSLNNELLMYHSRSINGNEAADPLKPRLDSHSEYLFYCERCNFQTNEQKEMIKHIHSKLSRCDSNPNKKRKIVMHRVDDSSIRAHNCPLCSYSATSEANLRHHAKREHPNFPPPFICPDCNKTFVYSSDYHRHCIIHTDQRNHVCQTCHLTFNRKSSLTAHIKRIHVGQESGSTDTTNCCGECGKIFGTKGDLQRHISGVHRNNKPYLCDQCEYRSDRNSNLMRHLLTRHGVEERGEEGEEEVDVVKVDHVVNVVNVDCEVLK